MKCIKCGGPMCMYISYKIYKCYDCGFEQLLFDDIEIKHQRG